MIKALLLVPLLAASPAHAGDDCLFDGRCAPRPALTISSPSPEAEPEAVDAGPSRWEGVKKGASEGALFGFFAAQYPAVALVSEGVGRQMSRGADGPRADNGGSAAYFYGGLALAAVLYIPALIIGGLGGLFGGAAGAAAPKTVADWDAEKTLFD